MSSPLVSIVVPVFNKENFIWDTLCSLQRQSFEDWECLLIEDGSTDQTPQLISAFVSNSRVTNKFRVISTLNRGQAAARNLGIREAKGNYIALLDADDVWHPRKLENQVKIMESNPELVGTICGYFMARDLRIGRAIRNSNLSLVRNRWISGASPGGALESAALMKRSFLIDELFDERLSISSGFELFIRISQRKNILMSPKLHVLYRLNSSQIHLNEEEFLRNLFVLKSTLEPPIFADFEAGIANLRLVREVSLHIRHLELNGLIALCKRIDWHALSIKTFLYALSRTRALFNLVTLLQIRRSYNHNLG